jgi:hypothetical protein
MNGIFYLVGLIVVAIIVVYALGHCEKAYDAALLPAKAIGLGHVAPRLLARRRSGDG